MPSLTGRVAIVTGGGRGIGRAIALALADAGAAVAVVARTDREIAETVRLIGARGGRALGVAGDVTDRVAVRAMVERVAEDLGVPRILVNNAAIHGPIGPLVDADPDAWDAAVRTNLVGTFNCCRAALPYMLRARGGKIINLSGGGATAARANFSAYAASKTAVVRLTETLAAEVAAAGIDVNAIAPGAVATRAMEEILAAAERAGEAALGDARRVLATGGTPPERPAALAVFLASDASNGLTGRLISALHDGWESWDERRIAELMSSAWLTLRRLDRHTLTPLLDRVP